MWRRIDEASASTFRYRAVREDGTVERGQIGAPSRDDAAATLRHNGLLPVELKAAPFAGMARRNFPLQSLGVGLRVIATLLESGLPLSRALSAAEDLELPGWEPVLPRLQAAIHQGQSFATALESLAIGVPPLVVGVIRAGEAGSGLPSAVSKSADLIEEWNSTASAIRGALAYPAVLLAVGTVSTALLVGVVLPRFANVLGDLGQSLPPAARVLTAAAGAVHRWWAPGGFAIVAAVLLFRGTLRNPQHARAWHALLLSVPLVRRVRIRAATSRACAALGALIENGVPLSSALGRAAEASGDAAVTARLLAARSAVLQGERLSIAAQVERALSPTACKLIRAGEESGRLASMLSHAARLEREQALTDTRNAIRLLEPLLIIGFGGAIALVAGTVLQALYSVNPVA